ncbi:029921dd-7c18-4b66-8ae2-d8d648ec5796 [Thermothielavioides terrestris]|jgi:hypothetical protein|uniref:Uncharacterized protein n=2 Tax=Thermothielavioides terrestris TaxID=2587410 RepID=G2R9F1_THETT|nr:uncharacterized protein THITE_2130407 [Thermothielavioides terrestris NRRL 8126]AEO68692.1 hypothetical protein THITE_2130407 [Thermothielavioides terrestris NRRL 8126]SPQ23034.1 029921dd-7c18-4b66-8ae2-d8d648ec5796 [Thermothielavioides terrestris]
MAAAVTPRSRYSNDAVAASDAAQSFPWEAPVPVNPFWDSFDYCTARNFLGNFSDHELEQLPIDPDSTDDHETKLRLLLRLLQAKIAQEEAASSPESLYTADYARWYSLWQGVYVFQDKLGLPEAEQTIRMLVARRPEGSDDVRPLHILAEHLVKLGKYREAEDTERPVCAWMDARPHLGKSSPQAINARRIIARALWGQGPPRRAEAKALLAEIAEIVNNMGGSRFGAYQEEERQLNRALMAELGNPVLGE